MRQEYAQSKSTESFKSYAQRTKAQIESELAKLVSHFSELNIYPQIRYSVLSEGKRLRPMLTIVSAESVGGKRDKVMPLALAFELMHTATLVHDDVIDRDEVRRGRPSVHKKWSVNDAILTGDALIALSVELASSYGERILKTVARSALELCDGEHMDITFSLKTATEQSYFKRIKEKSASLFRAAAYGGALAGGGTASEARSLSTFGENFGIAYQLRDDLLDLTQKGKIGLEDLECDRITLPLIHLYATSKPSEREQIESKICFSANGNHVDEREMHDLLHAIGQTNVFDYCEKKIDEHLRRAVSSLLALRETEYKSYLVEMTKALKNGASVKAR